MSRFITFEGIEGSGKSTQVRLLADALRADGVRVVVTREPGGTLLGEELRRILLESTQPLSAEAEAYLMTGARSEHVRSVIRPALEDGTVVLCDRFCDSTFAYQGAGRGLSVSELRALQQIAVGCTWPDLTVLLELPVELGLRRRSKGGSSNRIDRESLQFHERVADWYRAEAADAPARWRVVDATPPVSVVHTQVVNAVRELIPGKQVSEGRRIAR